MTTTRDSVLAAGREHMNKEANLLNRAGARVAGGLAKGLERMGQGLSSTGLGKGIDRAAIKARQSQLISTKADIQGQARQAARASEREAVKAQASAQNAQLRQAGGPQQREAMRQQFAGAQPSPEVMQARQQMAAIGGPKPMSPSPQAPSGQIGARVSDPVAAAPAPQVASSPVAPAAPAAPTAEVTPGTPAPMISSNAKKYLAIGAGGLAGGAMLSGGISGGSAAGRQQQMAPTMYPPGY